MSDCQCYFKWSFVFICKPLNCYKLNQTCFNFAFKCNSNITLHNANEKVKYNVLNKKNFEFKSYSGTKKYSSINHSTSLA